MRWNMNSSQINGYHLAVRHTLAYFMTVKASFSPTLHASHYCDIATHTFHSDLHLSVAAIPPKSSFYAHTSLMIFYTVFNVTAHLSLLTLSGNFVNTALPPISLLANDLSGIWLSALLQLPFHKRHG